jgi:hypothetical protein
MQQLWLLKRVQMLVAAAPSAPASAAVLQLWLGQCPGVNLLLLHIL